MNTEINDQRIETQIHIPIHPGHLEGDLSIPARAAGIVLFAHGSGSSRYSPRNQYVARVIREAGLGTLLFDLLTPAEERQDSVTGAIRFDIGLLARRLEMATHWVKKLPEIAPLKIGYFGSSTGGGAALVAAAEIGNGIAAVVSRGGRPDLAGEILPYVQSPTLLIVGELDKEVIQLNKQAITKLHCENELKIVPGATHLFQETGALEQVARLAARWFLRYLRRNSP